MFEHVRKVGGETETTFFLSVQAENCSGRARVGVCVCVRVCCGVSSCVCSEFGVFECVCPLAAAWPLCPAGGNERGEGRPWGCLSQTGSVGEE